VFWLLQVVAVAVQVRFPLTTAAVVVQVVYSLKLHF
jgi:hypothetical protein